MRKPFSKTMGSILSALSLAALFSAGASAQVTATSQTTITSSVGNTTGVAIDALGNLFISDGANGVVSESQGSNVAPTTILSGLTTPSELAFDTVRNLYIASGTQVVEVPYASGQLNLNSTVTFGKNLGSVTGVAVDLSGNLYVVDAGNKQVVKINGASQTTILTGLVAPKQIAVDRLGNVYVADAGANSVVYLPVGSTTPSTIGTGLNAPAGVAVDTSNNVYIADTGNNRIVEVPSISGVPTTSSQAVLGATVTAPTTIALDTRGTLYIGSGKSVIRYTAGAIYMGLVPVATTSQTFPVNISFTAALTPATIKVVTTGLSGLDYVDAGASTCAAGTAYAAGASCVVNVKFTPAGVGPRYGAIVMYGSNNAVLARIFVGGGGMGPLLTIDPGVLTVNSPSVTAPTYTTITTPRGITTDAAGNTFLAEYGYTSGGTTDPSRLLYLPAGSNTATVIASAGTNGVAINGAGDLINFSGSGTVTVYPYENGTWNAADVFTVATVTGSATRLRTGRVDVAGNIFFADAGASNPAHIYETNLAGNQVLLPYGSYATNCVGTAVDLYGNLACADSSAGKVLYVPVNGATPYETGSGYTSAWGVTFDASGSVWVSASGAAILGRIPNENGTLVGADQILSTVGNTKDFDIWIDAATGTLYTTQDSGNVVSAYDVITREASKLTFTTSTAIGNTNATTLTAYLSDSGNATATFTNGGVIGQNDVDDFPAKTPAGSACSFSLSLPVGFTCGMAFGFAPTSSGTRTATYNFSSTAIANPTLTLTGTSSSTVSGTAGLTIAVTNPTTAPAPGQALTVSVTAAASGTSTGTPTGAVTLQVDGKLLSAAELSSAGVATFSIPAGLSLGNHTLGATYAGDKTFAPITTAVTSTVTVVAEASTTNLVASATNVNSGQSVTFSATVPTVSGLATPTGQVTFYNGTTALQTVALNSAGVAVLTTSALPNGAQTITASYAGDSVYAASKSGAVTVNVGTYSNNSTTVLSVTPTQPAGGYVYGTALTAAISVAPQSGSGTPTGTIDLTLDGYPTTAPLSGGKATITLSSIGAGAHTLIAYYSGDSTYDASASAPYSFTVIKSATTTTLKTSANASLASVNVTLTATVAAGSATPGGVVNFMSGQTLLGSATLTNGVAVLNTTQLPAGTDSVTAVYQGDANDTGSTSAAQTITVAQVPTTIAIAATPSVILSGQTTTLTATVVGTVSANFSGSVNFYNGSTLIGSSTISYGGVATLTTSALTASSSSFSATYAGSPVFLAASTTTPAVVVITNPSGAGIVATTTLGSNIGSASGVAVDASGNLYIADQTGGNVTLVAGGAGVQSTAISGLSAPGGIAADKAGDLYVASGTSVKEYTSTNGALSTTSSTSFGSGLGTVTSVAVDASGNVYAIDATNKQLVKVTASGQTTVTTALTNPSQVAVDSLGDLYVADGTSNKVYFIPAGGTPISVGTGLSDPTGVAVDASNNLYIADTGNNRVVELPFTSGAPVTASQATIISSITAPGALTIDRRGAVYIAQGTKVFKWQNGRASFGVLTPPLTSPVYTITFTFQYAITPAKIQVLTNGQTGGDYALASGSTCAAGTAYTAGQSCTVNVTFTPSLAGIRPGAVVFSSATSQPLVTAYLGGVSYAAALNVDDFVGSASNEFTPTNTPATVAPMGNAIRGVVADNQGNIYACDNPNSRIIQTNTTGTVLNVVYAGTGCSSIGLDGAGNLLVDDMGNNRVILLPNEGGKINGADAYTVATGFSGPRGMNLDGFGNIYVADTTNVRIVAVPIGGTTTSQVVLPFTGLKSPYDAAVDWQGNVAVVDSSLAQVFYLPSNGTGQTTIGPTLCAPYALAMDGAGAVFVTEISTGCASAGTSGDDVVRITPSTGKFYQAVGHATSAEGISLDQYGNLYTGYGSQIVVDNRVVSPTLAFASTAVGSTSAAMNMIFAEGGPAPATFTGTGTFFLDSVDFAVATPTVTTAPACSFPGTLPTAAACEEGFVFQPQSAGTFTADYTPAAVSTNQVLVPMTGTGTGGGATTTATITLAVTSPASGNATPYQSVTLTSTLTASGTLSGTVTLTIDGAFISQQNAAATNTFVLPKGVSPGFHTAVVTYSGNSTLSPASTSLQFSAAGQTVSKIALVITPAATAVVPSLTSTPVTNTPIVMTATVTGTAGGATPSGQVIFYDGTTQLAVVPVSSTGTATYTYNGLTQGVHNLTAAYAGDVTYSTAVSAVAVETVTYPGDYTISAAPSSLTVTDGSTASTTLTFAPVANAVGGNYTGQIALSCTGVPAYASCQVSPNIVFLDGSGAPATATLTIVAEAQFAQGRWNRGDAVRFCLLPAGSLLLLFGTAGMRRRRKGLGWQLLGLVLCAGTLAGAVGSLTGCGSHAPLAAPSGTYNIVVTGTASGNLNHSITIPVTIKQQ